MKLVNATVFPFAVLPGKVRPPEWSATFLLKGSFALRPGGMAQALPEPLPLMGDVYRDEDIVNDCLYESDFAPWKPNVDLLLTGTCHAPGGKPTTACRVEFGVGRWSKALAVIGHRHWKKSLLLSAASDPEPFTSLPMTYEYAFGGAGFDRNPSGRGFEKGVLPNIEPLEDRITSTGDRPDPAGFGPLNRSWPQRASKLGSYKGKWLKDRWPFFPENFDYSYHNAAPEDQQLRKYLTGDEELRFENLHSSHPSYRSSLPGLRVRAFLSERLASGKRFREIPMHLDTLVVDMDRETLVLLWRGVAVVQSEECAGIEHALAVSELLKDPPAGLEKMESLLPKPTPAAVPSPAPAPRKPSPLQLQLAAAKVQANLLEAAHLNKAKEIAKAAGFDLEAAMAKPSSGAAELHATLIAAKGVFEKMGAKVPGLLDAEIAALAPGGSVEVASQKVGALQAPQAPPAVATVESLKEFASTPGGLKGRDLSGARLSGADLSGLDLSGAILRNADLSKAKMVKTVLKGAQVSKANLSGADLSEAVLEKADLTQTNLAGAMFKGAMLAQADLSGAAAAKVVLAGAQAPKAILAGAHLEGANLEKALLSGADLSRSFLEGAHLAGAILLKAALSGARGASADFTEADLSGAYADAGADFRQGIFLQIQGAKSVWEGCNLDGANFTGAMLERANFSGASLNQAKMSGVDAKNASFQKASMRRIQALDSDFFEATFEKADLSEATLAGCSCFGSDFLGTVLTGTQLRGTNVKMTRLA